VSGAAVAAVAKSALAPTAKEIASLFMMFSKRGVSKLQQPADDGCQPIPPRSGISSQRPQRQSVPAKCNLYLKQTGFRGVHMVKGFGDSRLSSPFHGR
jgi:hypothetical protein